MIKVKLYNKKKMLFRKTKRKRLKNSMQKNYYIQIFIKLEKKIFKMEEE